MKVAAHPLVVAVAMGLLGPRVLADDPDTDEEPCVDCDDPDVPELVQVPSRSDEPDLDAWMGRPPPSADTQARALAEYLASTQV